METNKYYMGILNLNKIIQIKIQAILTPLEMIRTTRIIETIMNITSIASL
jgi:hypothetical protein